MTIVKNAIRRSLGALGYELRRNTGDSVRFEHFENLALAYEKSINASNELVAPNAMRLKLLARLAGTPPFEAYCIIQALSQCKDVSGDVCEFGVAQGETSALIANEIASSAKAMHLFDSFEGLPKPTEKDQLKDDVFALGSMEAYAGTMSYPEDMVRARLAAISFPTERFVIHKGYLENTIYNNTALPKQVSFAYVDFDFYEPIKVALEYLHGVTRPGAILIVDDYDYFSTGAKTATDEFVQAKHADGTDYECFVPDKRLGHFAVLTRKS
jgi:hypothetical protein